MMNSYANLQQLPQQLAYNPITMSHPYQPTMATMPIINAHVTSFQEGEKDINNKLSKWQNEVDQQQARMSIGEFVNLPLKDLRNILLKT